MYYVCTYTRTPTSTYTYAYLHNDNDIYGDSDSNYDTDIKIIIIPVWLSHFVDGENKDKRNNHLLCSYIELSNFSRQIKLVASRTHTTCAPGALIHAQNNATFSTIQSHMPIHPDISESVSWVINMICF